MQSYWITVAPNSSDCVLIRMPCEDTDTERKSCEDRSRDYGHAPASQGMPRIAGTHQNPGRDKEGLFLRTFRESMTLPTP